MLLDLSQGMLDRACERVSRATTGRIWPIQADIRDTAFADNSIDIVLAAAVLHHLRTDREWHDVFASLHRAIRPSGSFWIFDLIESSIPAVQSLMWNRYGEFLTNQKNAAYRDDVFGYIQKEDTPRPLMFQLDLLREVGFSQVEILHKNSCFAAFAAIKS
jgi:tRNA (cmo5U34)-methyltransferase